ncbi:hypothetical protein TrST_g11363 [Triparma strigata]|uniref:Uncharacterized protein n=1 Tax=Triparma strigata TaxID=1606541 RepID=A0A9W7EHA5_9STRA|nr:hypothetical protein TrST_g11363 [Triparma strigata]
MVRIKEEEIRRIERMAEENITRHEDDMSTIASGSIFSSIFTQSKGVHPPSETVLRTRKLEVTDWSDPTFSSDPKMYPLEFKGVTKVIKYKKDEVKADKVWEPTFKKFVNKHMKGENDDVASVVPSVAPSVSSQRSSRSYGWIKNKRKKDPAMSLNFPRAKSPARGSSVASTPVLPRGKSPSRNVTHKLPSGSVSILSDLHETNSIFSDLPETASPKLKSSSKVSHFRTSSQSSNASLTELISPPLKPTLSDDETLISFASSPNHRSDWSLPSKSTSRVPSLKTRTKTPLKPRSSKKKMKEPSSPRPILRNKSITTSSLKSTKSLLSRSKSVGNEKSRLSRSKSVGSEKSLGRKVRGRNVHGDFEGLGFLDLGTKREKGKEKGGKGWFRRRE